MKAAPAEEELKGNPRSVRVDARDNDSSEMHLQAYQDYFAGARLRQSQVFQPDGTFSYFFVYEYDEDNQLLKESTYWQGNLHTETEHLPQEKNGVQVIVTRSVTGQELERAVTRYNEAGQAIECTNLSDSVEAHLVAQYDDRSVLLDAKVMLPDGSELTLPLDIDPAYQIVARDAFGNWIEKTTPFNTLYRNIEYY